MFNSLIEEVYVCVCFAFFDLFISFYGNVHFLRSGKFNSSAHWGLRESEFGILPGACTLFHSVRMVGLDHAGQSEEPNTHLFSHWNSRLIANSIKDCDAMTSSSAHKSHKQEGVLLWRGLMAAQVMWPASAFISRPQSKVWPLVIDTSERNTRRRRNSAQQDRLLDKSSSVSFSHSNVWIISGGRVKQHSAICCKRHQISL